MIRKRLLFTLALLLTLLTFFLGERGIYWVYSWTWAWPQHSVLQNHDPLETTTSPNPFINSHVSTKILVISDPHIQCTFNLYEPWLLRWDSDTYLQRGFSQILSQLQPDMVIVLGDLFAEGYKASDIFWLDYLEVGYDYPDTCTESLTLKVVTPFPPYSVCTK